MVERSLLPLMVVFVWGQVTLGAEPAVDYQRQIRPILVENCYACHGPDEKARKAELRLDQRDAGQDHVITPGQADESELIARITSDQDDFRMPPPEAEKRLTEEQIALLRTWIQQGANWTTHWSFVPARRPDAPPVNDDHWCTNPIDRFILARLEKEQLHPSPEAARRTLIRRLSLDLIGLPPTPEEVQVFVADSRGDAYERLVDRLLASPHFGERLAQHWLDLARFGDSDGYHDDTPRVMYQFRDYVIRSFNTNKPFDQFTIEQLAGDLLPNATLEQKIGSAFHRCGPTSSEGGADAQEYMAKYAVDRVNTTAVVWLGITLQCAECHDHKYDPFTTREYYQLFGFFDQVPEDPLFRGNDAPPVIPTPSDEQSHQLAEFNRRIDELDVALSQLINEQNPQLDAEQQQWEQRLVAGQTEELELSEWQAIGPFTEKPGAAPFDYVYPPEENIDTSANYEDGTLKWAPHSEWTDGKVHYLPGDKCATYLYRTIRTARKQPLTLYLGSDDGIKVWVNGKQVHSFIAVRVAGANQDKVEVVLEPGENQLLMKIVNLQGGYGFYFSTRETERDEQLEQALAIARIPAEKREQDDRDRLRRYYRERFVAAAAELAAQLASVRQQRSILEQEIPKLRVMADVPERRPTYILVRGDFRSLGDQVHPQVPAILGRLPAEGNVDRLALARWLVAPDQPLTSRVVINRFWQLVFGQGLVRTANDFGVRGDVPSHPELLDWLAAEFVESGWDVKHMFRLMVTSATYRQASQMTPELQDLDPQNVLLAHGPRYRMPAEMVRDHALAISGLLEWQIGGRSVKPYQPGDLWREMSYGDQPDKAYVQDHGANLYRRGIYTYWKRSIHYPAFAVIDAPSREVCTAQRPITNTPLQALVLMNDVTYAEAARVLAQNLLLDGPQTTAARTEWLFERVLARPATPQEHDSIERLHQRLVVLYKQDSDAANAVVAVGEYARPNQLDVVEHAVWTNICQALLNLDEALSKE